MTNDISSMDEITTETPALLNNLTDNGENKGPYRWCFGPRQDETEVARSCTLSANPQIVKSDTPWKHQLELSDVAVGWYSLVFCVSFQEEPNTIFLESITFDAKPDDSDAKPGDSDAKPGDSDAKPGDSDAKPGDSEGREIKNASTMTVVSKEDIEHRSRTGRTFLRLHHQTNISGSSKCLNLTITIKTTAETTVPLSFELHHIELTTKTIQLSSAAEGPVYIYGEDKPDLFIKVGDHSTSPVEICAYDISDTGTHIATIYLIGNTAYLDIWDILKQTDNVLPGRPQSITAPSARHSFPLENGHKSANLKFDVAISVTGLQAAVCSLDDLGKAFVPFTIYSCWPEASAEHTPRRSRSFYKQLISKTAAEHTPGRSRTLYKQLISRTRFKRAFGNIAFRAIDSTTDSKDVERFFKFDGITFDVYKPSGYWRRLFSIPVSIGKTPRAMMAKTLFYSIRKRLFAYTGTRGFVTIWDFETRRIISNIFVPVDTMPSRVSISRDGSLVAIAVKGVIHVHDVQTGILLGTLKEGLNEADAFEMEFVQDYLTILNYATSTTEYSSQPQLQRVVKVRDMSTAVTYSIQPKYRLQTPQANGVPIFAFDQGAILNISKHMHHSPTEEIPWHINCIADVKVDVYRLRDNPLDLTDSHGTTFKLTTSDVPRSQHSAPISLIAVEDALGMRRSAKISFGETTHSPLQGFYLKKSSQLFIISSCYLQVWHLSTIGSSICELLYIWKLDPDDSKHTGDYNCRTLQNVKTCKHGKSAHIAISPTQRIWHGDILQEDVPRNNDIVTVPICPTDTLKLTEDMRLVGGVQHLVTVYAESDSIVQKSILRYLMKCVRPSSKHSESSLVSLCRAWIPKNRSCIREIVDELLPHENVTWIPHMSASKSKDPLAILLMKTRRWPAVSVLVKIFTGYCIHHATRTSDPSFLAPIFASMSDLLELLPGYAKDFLTKVSYMPTKQRAFILQNHIIAHPPKVFLKFWQSRKESLVEAKNPILQTNGTPAKYVDKNNEFHQQLFIASFNMLWNYKENAKFKMARLNGNTWWKTLYHVFTLKLRLRTHTYIECHNFNLEIFDNPAIAALVSYKWNTIGFMYWSFRFTFQFIFYVLVIAAAFLQVFHSKIHRVQITAVLTAIIVFGVAFLWLELLQAIKKGKKYRTIYNQLDVLVYSVPVGTSVQQMIALHENNPAGYTKILSFAVLIVFLHALFELRVFKGVCKSVSIIQHTVVEIRAFFFIFAAGIVAFAIATLHLLRACPVLEGCKELTTKFSGDFLRALSTTYFFMGGRYDDVDDEFVSETWEFHLMMAVYFFFTVIVMLNVLIALINVAFTKGDDSWRLVWIESRLRYIESAEELSYHIPGFRQSHDWFPREIFYTTTPQKAKAYREKYHSNASKNKDRDLLVDWELNDYEDMDEDQEAARTRVVGASQNENDVSSASANEEVEDKNKEEQKDQDENENEDESKEDCTDDDEGDEEVVDIDSDEEELPKDQDEDAFEDALVIKGLKVQVAELQKQVSRQVKAQQELLKQSQRQYEELRELLLAQNRA